MLYIYMDKITLCPQLRIIIDLYEYTAKSFFLTHCLFFVKALSGILQYVWCTWTINPNLLCRYSYSLVFGLSFAL